MNIVFLGLSITSSWGNGHATTYRGLVRELCARGHDVLFLERDVPWYADNRDLADPPYGRTALYTSLRDLQTRFRGDIAGADAVIVGSYVPDGVSVGEWVASVATGSLAFYDIDTPVTLAKLRRDDYEYVTPALVREYDLYLSFTGGPTLDVIEKDLGSPMARPLYCSFDPEQYFPELADDDWDLGYSGTYSEDRQPMLDALMLESARRWRSGRFVVAGPQYPDTVEWPANVRRIEHLPPAEHRRFYNAQRFSLNLTRSEMVRAGYSPSVRLFEAAACGVPVISDWWAGLDTIFIPGEEILIARTAAEVLEYLREMSESDRRAIGQRARHRALRDHTAAHRAAELEGYLEELAGVRRGAEALKQRA